MSPRGTTVQPLVAALTCVAVSFGKPPMPPALVAALRGQADVERHRLLMTPPQRFPVLQELVNEELAVWEGMFGEDDRLRPHATSLAIAGVLNKVGRGSVDGDAVIEALAATMRLDDGESFTDPVWASWAATVTSPPPKNSGRKRDAAPSDYAINSAVEMYWAFSVTNGYDARGHRDPFEDARTWFLVGIAAEELRKQIDAGARFERDPDAIVLDWLARPRHLHLGYRPGGNSRAPGAFLATAFRFELDDERRLVGAHSVLPAWIRRMRRRGWLGKDELLTEAVVERLIDRARASLIHAPPAGFINTAMLREILVARQDAGPLAHHLAACRDLALAPAELRQELLDCECSDKIVDWLLKPASSRPALPEGLLDGGVALSPRSVDALVTAYERARSNPFARAGRSKLVPIGEVDRIVEFANSRGGGPRRGKAADPST